MILRWKINERGVSQAVEKCEKVETYRPMNGEMKDEVSEKAFRM